MSYNNQTLRRQFFLALIHDLAVTWPVLSGVLAIKLGIGMVVGLLERWGPWQGLYFACITGITIGCGDLVPTWPVTRVLAVAIGVSGIILTGLIVALAVRALQHTAVSVLNDDQSKAP